jgi:hypothetical protein
MKLMQVDCGAICFRANYRRADQGQWMDSVLEPSSLASYAKHS